MASSHSQGWPSDPVQGSLSRGESTGLQCLRRPLKRGEDALDSTDMDVAQNETGGVTRVLVHVSTYQGSILVPVF